MQEMKYFNEGNDCDICKNQLMTGRDGTVEDCRRRQNGLSCRFEERDIRTCPLQNGGKRAVGSRGDGGCTMDSLSFCGERRRCDDAPPIRHDYASKERKYNP